VWRFALFAEKKEEAKAVSIMLTLMEEDLTERKSTAHAR